MKIAVFSTKPYDKAFLTEVNKKHKHELSFFEARLTLETVRLANGFDCVCAFVNDSLAAEVLSILSGGGTRLIALRSAGFNHVNLKTAQDLGLSIARVPAYSPHAVAEHALALILALNRKIHRAFNRVREANFALDGLMGFDIHGKTIGVIGTGKIGQAFIEIVSGFGGKILAYDPYPNGALKAQLSYVDLAELFAKSTIISLHCPLTPETHHIINKSSLAQMQDGTMLINTSRGALVDTTAVINALKSGKLGHLGLDVYEEEGDLFFEDLSNKVIQDDVFTRLLTFPNVIITGHQGFFTQEALLNIAETTLANVTAFESGQGEWFEVKYES